jgi:hypothetical protein
MQTEHATTHDALEDPRNADILIYVNGALKPRAEAVVSVYDSGFLLGDGMWEGMRLYDGVWAFLRRAHGPLFRQLQGGQPGRGDGPSGDF